MNNEKKEVKLIKKAKHLIKCLGYPRWLHHFGPKTYEFYEHLCALLVRYFCRLSYRNTEILFDLFSMRCPSKSALQYTAKKLSQQFWDRVLKLTSGKPFIAALDSTGFSRTNPSYHYLRRIDGKLPKIPIKLSAALNTRTKKWCAAKVRILPTHDIKDARKLLEKSQPQIAVADKAYSIESLYAFAQEKKILLMCPMKKNVKRGFVRKNMHKQFRTRTYHRRSMVEAGFGSIKRKFGASVSSKLCRTIRSDIYGRLVAHNIFHMLYWTFRTEPQIPYSNFNFNFGFFMKSIGMFNWKPKFF